MLILKLGYFCLRFWDYINDYATKNHHSQKQGADICLRRQGQLGREFSKRSDMFLSSLIKSQADCQFLLCMISSSALLTPLHQPKYFRTFWTLTLSLPPIQGNILISSSGSWRQVGRILGFLSSRIVLNLYEFELMSSMSQLSVFRTESFMSLN